MSKPHRIAVLAFVVLGGASAIVAWRGLPVIPSPQEAEERAEGGDQEVPEGQGQTAEESAEYAQDQEDAERPPQWEAIDLHNEATRGPLQPIPFNHRFHVTDLQIDCMYCHVGTEESVSGVVPALEVCMSCHRFAGTGLPPVEELREYFDRGEPVQWQWVNKLPEYVQFSHKPHLRNQVECAECHGPVEEMDRVYQWSSFRMGWCLECHRRPGQETDFATDRLLSLETPPPPTPAGRQPHSFYPRAIESEYGTHRGPIDCAACHY